MKVKDAIYGDYRKSEVRDLIQTALRKIPALSKHNEENDIPLEALEKAIWKMREKYGCMMQYIMPLFRPELNEAYYSCSFKTKEHEWIGTVNGLTIYEVYAKGVLMLYSYARKANSNLQ